MWNLNRFFKLSAQFTIFNQSQKTFGTLFNKVAKSYLNQLIIRSWNSETILKRFPNFGINYKFQLNLSNFGMKFVKFNDVNAELKNVIINVSAYFRLYLWIRFKLNVSNLRRGLRSSSILTKWYTIFFSQSDTRNYGSISDYVLFWIPSRASLSCSNIVIKAA